MPRIALATCLELPEPDPDKAALLDAVRALGAHAEWLAWDDATARFAEFDACVLRSTWNYIHVLDDFLAWADRTAGATRLLNPADVVRWNSDKTYLRDLAARGVPTVPTCFVPKGGHQPLGRLVAEQGWREVVVKPRVGAGSFATRRFNSSELEAGEAFLAEWSGRRDMLVQPYLRSVSETGERALVWIAGELTHAIRKEPRWSGGAEAVSKALAPTDEERAFAAQVLRGLEERLLYARVDAARDDAGRLVLMELELIEPSLFVIQEPRALKVLAEAVVRAAGRRP